MPNLQVDEWLDLARGETLQLFDGARASVLGTALFDSGGANLSSSALTKV